MSETLPWNLPLPRLLAELGSTPEGLSAREVERRLAKYGPNDALLHRRRPLWRQILDRFANPLILILLFASGLSAWTGEVTSFALIVGIILLSVVLDVVQQARAENTVDALRRSVGLKAEVLRDGKVVEVAVDRLVPGDVVELRAGDIVPGDCRLLVARDTPGAGQSGMRPREGVKRQFSPVLDLDQWDGADPGFGISLITSVAFLSVRSPRKTGWRISPFEVHSVNFTSPTSLGLTQVVFASSGTFSAMGFVLVMSGTISACRDLSDSRSKPVPARPT